VLAAAVATVVGGAALGDVIELKDGRKFSGKVMTAGTKAVITTDDGGRVETDVANLASVKQITGMNKEEVAAAEWKRVAAAAKAAPEVREAVVLHERFLRVYGETAMGPAARESLEKYQKMADGGAVKIKGEWITAEAFEQVRKGWEEAAAPAMTFYKVGQMKEALSAATTALVKDPQNQDAMEIAGMAAYRTNNLTLAQRHFRALADGRPGNLLGTHNAAVLYATKKDATNAARLFSRALQVKPTNRLLVDNVCELLHAYPEAEKKLPAYRELGTLYDQAEAKLEGEMLKQKLYRWGATWVKEDQLAKLNGAYEDVQKQMQALDARYQAAQVMLPEVDAQIAQAQSEAATLDGRVFALQDITSRTEDLYRRRGSTYNSYAEERARLLQNLQQARERLATLQQKKIELTGQIKEMEARAPGLKAQLAKTEPQFTGMYRIMEIGEEETPPGLTPVKKGEESLFK
jgi:hypothetical protein